MPVEQPNHISYSALLETYASVKCEPDLMYVSIKGLRKLLAHYGWPKSKINRYVRKLLNANGKPIESPALFEL